MDIIKRINELAKERGWSMNQLALEAELTQSTLGSMLSRGTPPKIDTLKRLCDAFGMTLSQFFADGESEEYVSQEEKQLLFAYRTLTERQKKALLELLTK